MQFCGQCATPLTAAHSVAVLSTQTYTPAHLAEKILTSRGALKGERKQVTVLLADLKGSMVLLADWDPEVSCRQKATAWELRVGRSLSLLWMFEARRQEARDLLAPIDGGLTEGFNTADLRAAKVFLEALASRDAADTPFLRYTVGCICAAHLASEAL
jgi:hypothetical protein